VSVSGVAGQSRSVCLKQRKNAHAPTKLLIGQIASSSQSSFSACGRRSSGARTCWAIRRSLAACGSFSSAGRSMSRGSCSSVVFLRGLCAGGV